MVHVTIKHIYVLFYASLRLFSASAKRCYAMHEGVISHPNWPLLDRGNDCGRSEDFRIIGGKNAGLGQYPWIARLLYQRIEESRYFSFVYECGGSIISDRYILTAAHCDPEVVRAPLIEVRLGEHSMETDPDCVDHVCAPSVQDIRVEELICHENYDKHTYRDDICLIRLSRPIRFNDFVSPICLPVHEIFQQVNYEGKVLEVAGWGVEDIFLQKGSEVLQTLRVKVTNHLQCKDMYKDKADITDRVLCAGGVIGQDSCNGDSGGPLMGPYSVTSSPKYFLLGLVSFGPEHCANSIMPAVYTLVPKFLAWILDNVRE